MNVQVLSFTVVLLTACRLLHVNFYCFIFWSLTFSQCTVLLTESCSMEDYIIRGSFEGRFIKA